MQSHQIADQNEQHPIDPAFRAETARLASVSKVLNAEYELAKRTRNCVLVYEADDQSVATRYCSKFEADDYLDEIGDALKGASVFTLDSLVNVEDVLKVSPQLRQRIEDAKLKLRSDIRVRDTLIRNGVALNRTLLSSIHGAFIELQSDGNVH